ncbi:MAG: hypothetical protein LBV39_00885 [Bacteroidales bacterium]|jgi:hypothetical protein|nr:hypothetical protein [Bacteroidales bacterium]
MSYIKEPDGVDFVIAPSSYTDEDRALISAHLREYKRKERANMQRIKKRSGYNKLKI